MGAEEQEARAELEAGFQTETPPNAAAYRAYLLSMTGRAEDCVAFMRRAIQLNPYHPGYYWNMLARVLADPQAGA